MVTLGITYPTEPLYARVTDFAREIYTDRLQAPSTSAPEYFAYAQNEEQVLGCVGITRAQPDTPLMLERYVPDALARLSGAPHTPRQQFAELGTRAVRVARASPTKSATISLGITALALATAYLADVRYICLTANRTAQNIAQALALPLTYLGEPDVARMDASFRAAWTEFFRVKQYCFGCVLDTDAGCRKVLATLKTQGFLQVPPLRLRRVA